MFFASPNKRSIASARADVHSSVTVWGRIVAQNPYSDVIESRVLSATPVGLVSMLMNALGSAVDQAQVLVQACDVAGRAREISRAQAIVLELSQSLDMDAGGEIALRLRDLYAYMFTLLQQANVEQSAEPLVPLRKIVAVLAESWAGIDQPSAPSYVAAEAWSSGFRNAGGLNIQC